MKYLIKNLMIKRQRGGGGAFNIRDDFNYVFNRFDCDLEFLGITIELKDDFAWFIVNYQLKLIAY